MVSGKKSNVLLWIAIAVGVFLAVIQNGGEAEARTWLPEYPGSKMKCVLASHRNYGKNETFTFTTGDPADQVVKFYRSAFQSAGLAVNHSTFQSGAWGFHSVLAQDSGQRRVAHVTASFGNGTTVNVTYTSK